MSAHPSQSVLDALADARTLELVSDELSWTSDAAYSVWALLREADAFNADPYLPAGHKESMRRAVRLAFLAVPDLREATR